MSSVVERRIFQSSELSRQSKAVFDAVQGGAVQITRRDGDRFILMSESEANARDGLLKVAGRLLAAATDSQGSFVERLMDSYPWMLALSAEGRETCAQELLEAARASFETGHSHLVLAELTSWRETAEALAAGLGDEPVELLEDMPLVPHP